MSIDFEELRRLVATQHGGLLSKDDPVLVTITLSDQVLEHYIAMVDERIRTMSQELTLSLESQAEQAKVTAGGIITEAADYVGRTARIAIEEAVSKAVVRAVEEIEPLLVKRLEVTTGLVERAERQGRGLRSVRLSVAVGAAVAIISALLALVALVAVTRALRPGS